VRYAVKEARLQTPELTNRNWIGGRESWVSKHIFVKLLTNKRLCVDAAGLGGRISVLPGEVSLSRVDKGEVSSGHSSRLETSHKHYASPGSEGPNVKLPEIR